MIKISMMTYTMARQGYQPADFIRTALDCGLDGIDWVSTYGKDPRELRRMSDDAGLPVVCHTFFLSGFINHQPDWLDEARKSLEDAVILGAPLVMIPTPARGDTTDRHAYRREWIGALAEIAPLADDAGLILTVENFPGKFSPFVTAADFLEARRAIPQLRLTFDNGNAASGEDPVESFNQCAEYAVHVHFKDWDIIDRPNEGYREMSDGRYYRATLIGEGDIDTAGCWKALKDYGYSGCVNIEYEGNTYKADEAIRMVTSLLRSL